MSREILRDFETELMNVAEKKMSDILKHLDSYELVSGFNFFYSTNVGAIVSNIWNVGDAVCFVVKARDFGTGFVYLLYIMSQRNEKMEVRRILIGRWETNCTHKGENRLIRLGCDLSFDDMYGLDAGSRANK